jgi:hypothetical protein
MTTALDLRLLSFLPPVFFYAAMAAWTLALIGLVHHMITGRPPRLATA